jgi:integrase
VPTTPEGVYRDERGWYFKVTVGRDPLSRKREQVTRRGFRTATEAAQARRELLTRVDTGLVKAAKGSLTVNELLDLYLDGIDADGKLSPKTRYDYREKANAYVRPLIGSMRVRDVTPEIVLAWQRKLLGEGVCRRPLGPNTVRLARAPLSGAFKLARASGIIAFDPMLHTPRPTPKRSVPRHWSPEQARQFLGLMEGDRTYPIWAFLIGSGLRIGELVALRWPNIDLDGQVVRIVEFVTYVGHELVSSPGKSRDAVRSIDLDEGVVRILRMQRLRQKEERLVAEHYEESDYVFTKPTGGPYHPQYLSRLLSSYTKELGLPRLSAHGLRHTCATLMLANGVPPKVAAERLGHSDPSLFLNLYSHVTPTMQKEAARLIGVALFGEQ